MEVVACPKPDRCIVVATMIEACKERIQSKSDRVIGHCSQSNAVNHELNQLAYFHEPPLRGQQGLWKLTRQKSSRTVVSASGLPEYSMVALAIKHRFSHLSPPALLKFPT